jgi:hypothetical protein
MHASNRFRIDQIEFLEAALRAEGFMQQRTHRPIGNENPRLQSLFEIVNLHGRTRSVILLLSFVGL